MGAEIAKAAIALATGDNDKSAIEKIQEEKARTLNLLYCCAMAVNNRSALDVFSIASE